MAFARTAEYIKYFATPRISQYEYYSNSGATEEILKLITVTNNRAFGALMEKIVRGLFEMSKPEPATTKYDAIYKGRRIEIKAARYWVDVDVNCMWQHIEPTYDYEWVLFVLVDLEDLKFWIAPKDVIVARTDIFTKQGKQGLWGWMKDIITIAHPIASQEDLDRVIFAE